MPLRIRAHQVMAHHLPENRLPLAFVIVFADAECGQAVMAAFGDFGRLVAGQDVDQMPRAKPFLGA